MATELGQLLVISAKELKMENRTKAKATNDDINTQAATLSDLPISVEQAEQAKGGRTLGGGAGDDILIGGEGRDVLFGGAGLDVLIGNTGGDR
jgi:Ca2+-binding RTX toxin-like protein